MLPNWMIFVPFKIIENIDVIITYKKYINKNTPPVSEWSL